MNRRHLLLGAAALTLWAAAPVRAASLPPVTVWKSPTCECCTHWVAHMKAAGFALEVHDVEDIDRVKAEKGIPADAASCHTALVAGYLLEGHVPAAAVKRLLAERPKARGLAVPGMPHGAPGMETGHVERYDVLLLTDAGSAVFESH